MKWLRPAYFSGVIHTAVWVLLLAIPTMLFRRETFFGLPHNFFLLSTIYHIAIFYWNAYFLYPALLTKKKWWLYILVLAAIIGLSYYAKIYILQLSPAFHQTADNSRVIFFGLIPFLIASIIFRLVSDRIRFEKLEKEARAERLGAELKFLRSQVSPHFLFNMMTNMVALARQKSDLLEPSLIRLSELLRYMLYDSAEEKIAVTKEIEQLENYIALQYLRFGEDVKMTVKINNECRDCLIEPMLLVPFIENAFKHGVGMVKYPYINIQLNIKEQLLHFEVTNNYNNDNPSKDKNAGIGLANVQNRLNLLYRGKHELVITNSAGIFSVSLNMDLS